MEVFKPENIMTLVWISLGILLVVLVILTIIKFLNKDKTLSAVERAIKEKNFSKALKLAQQHLKGHEHDIVILNLMAQVYEGLNNYKTAIDYYERASVAAEKEAQTNLKIQMLLKIGTLYKKIEMTKDALGYFSLILDEQPRHSKALYEAADLLYNLKNYRKAREYLATLIQIKSDNLRGHFLYARTLYQLGEYQSCAKQLSAIIPNLPHGDATISKARLLLADSLVKLRQYKQAIQTLNTLLNDSSLFENVLLKIVSIQILDHNYVQAIALARKYVNRVSREIQVDVFYQVANAYFKEGEIYNALQNWQQAYQIDPKYRDTGEILNQYRILLDNPQLKPYYTRNNAEFESFILRTFTVKTVNQVIRDPHFFIITGGDEVHIFYRNPSPISTFTLDEISKHLHSENFNTITVYLYSLFSADSAGKNHLLYKRLQEFSGESMIARMKRGESNG